MPKMRAVLIIPTAIIAPLALFSAFRMVTGDPSSAVSLGLLMLLTLGALLHARPGRVLGRI
ncbi:MAG: hypothetical protein JO109_11595 [Alphaproteobacteria bacterium]|nr:hypothetical protein [Alphaproteobacteria bacterium]